MTLADEIRAFALKQYVNPPLTPKERETAAIEGWILGMV